MEARQKMKMRKSTRFFIIVIVTALLVIGSSSFIQVISKNEIVKIKEEIYNYTNQYNYNYTVNLKSNKYIEEQTLTMDEVYVTDLINNAVFNFNYNYMASSETNIKYSYKIIGKLQAVYTKDGLEQKVLDKEETLKESGNLEITSDKIELQEPLQLNLAEKNKFITDFEQEMNMSLDAIYTLIFQIETKTDIEGRTVDNEYSSSISIELGEKTTEINGENNIEKTTYVTNEKEEKQKIDMCKLGISCILIIFSSIILYYIHTNTVIINKIRNDYRYELNKMLRICQDKIIKINDKADVKLDTVIDVKDFDEIIKASDELFKPIIYWESKDDDEAWFNVISGEITYRFVYKNNS